jgi:hypothetical protein
LICSRGGLAVDLAIENCWSNQQDSKKQYEENFQTIHFRFASQIRGASFQRDWPGMIVSLRG